MAFGSSGSDGRQHDRVEYVEFGSPRKRGRAWLSRLLLVCVVIAAVVAVVGRSSRQHGTAAQPPRPVPQPRAAPLPPVRVVDVGHRLLGVTAGWELFGLN